MKILIAAVIFSTIFSIHKGNAMEPNTALKLIKSWGQDSKDMTLISQIQVDAKGGFVTKSAGAFFRYDASTKRLLVSGLVGYNVKLHSNFPDTWEKMTRASKREWATLGDGHLELYRQKLFGFEPDVILLTKDFTDTSPLPAQFVKEIDWLLSAAHYWSVKRYNEVLVTPEKVLVVQGPEINDEMLKMRPRPW